MTAASASRRTSSSTTRPGRAVRMRQEQTPNPWASSSARSANAFGDWPETSRTVTRSAHAPAWTLPSTGRVMLPR